MRQPKSPCGAAVLVWLAVAVAAGALCGCGTKVPPRPESPLAPVLTALAGRTAPVVGIDAAAVSANGLMAPVDIEFEGDVAGFFSDIRANAGVRTRAALAKANVRKAGIDSSLWRRFQAELVSQAEYYLNVAGPFGENAQGPSAEEFLAGLKTGATTYGAQHDLIVDAAESLRLESPPEDFAKAARAIIASFRAVIKPDASTERLAAIAVDRLRQDNFRGQIEGAIIDQLISSLQEVAKSPQPTP